MINTIGSLRKIVITQRTKLFSFTRMRIRYVRVFAVEILSVVSLSVVCLSSVTFGHPTQPVKIFDNVSMLFCSLAIH